MAKTDFQSIDEYISACPPESQEYLAQIRTLIRELVPNAKEKISYQIACFELNGRNLIHFAGWKKHISIYPVHPGSDAFNKKIAQYVDGRGTLKFPLDELLPLKLIGEIVKLKVSENLKNANMKSGERK